jgi:dihydrofolate synthase/folylpolyglutamate synthase
MNYREALDYILSFADYERATGFGYSNRFDLRRVEEFLLRLGNPHLKSKSIHIAGSKGKGSTAAMISSALTAEGYKTGLYTSPHLHTFRERMSINGKIIEEERFAQLVQKLKPEIVGAVRELSLDIYGKLTTFEILTALAFLYFCEENVAYQVLETGLGGRLDATNVVNSKVCVITSISLDHTAVLGNTISEIAVEKAGIIKPNAVVVSSCQELQAAEVIKNVCLEKNGKLIVVGKDAIWEKKSANLEGQSFLVETKNNCYDLTIPLLGEHQLENAATAVATLEALGISKEAISSGLAEVRWPGRLEILRQNPVLVVDGAHNPDSAKKLRESLSKLFHFRHLTFIIGVLANKDVKGILRELAPIADKVIVTHFRHPRAAQPSVLLDEFNEMEMEVEVTESVAQAVFKALAEAGKEDLICATGSLFVVAEAIEYVRNLPYDRLT